MIDGDAHGETALLLPAIDGEDAVGGQGSDGLRVTVVHLKDLRLLGVGIQCRLKDSGLPEFLTHQAAQLRLVHNRLGEDVTRACKRVGGGRYILFGIHKGSGDILGRTACLALQQHCVCESFESALACDGGARALLLLVRAIKILEGLELFGGFDGCAQLVRQLALLLDACAYFLLPLDEAAQICEARLHLTQHLVLKGAGRLLAVACNKGNRIAVIEEGNDGFDLLRTDGELARDRGGNVGNTHGIKPFFLLSTPSL